MARESLSGMKDGSTFSDFQDADELLGPFLEIFQQGEYYWLPLSGVKQLAVDAPRTLRDLLWIPARVELHERPLGEVFLPTLYFGSNRHADDAVKLGRMTDWKTVGDGTLLGAGLRTFLADETECPLLEIRNVEFKVGR